MDSTTISKIWETIYTNIIPIILFCSIFIEIVPVKFNPLSALVEWLFKPVKTQITDLEVSFNKSMEDMRKELDEEISKANGNNEETKKILERIEANEDRRRFATIRWEVLEFANSINNGTLHTHHEYQHIYDDIEEYESLHKKYDELTNGYLEDAIVDIRGHYDIHKNQNLKYF